MRDAAQFAERLQATNEVAQVFVFHREPVVGNSVDNSVACPRGQLEGRIGRLRDPRPARKAGRNAV
ncbi:hypothetical protein PUN4_490091 [Paraburkholderia unamae]|nr:hypothetical protein PUN4_490091 [Paraburkholderia unamae]